MTSILVLFICRVLKVARERQPLPLYQQVLRQQARQGRQRGRDR